ncbi:MAG TPA: hypothetical protein VE961_16135 [Pyrinomonadaceae bacterium]|nr:hypothetical protein [Pyrinomonadaceae bacterium]
MRTLLIVHDRQEMRKLMRQVAGKAGDEVVDLLIVLRRSPQTSWVDSKDLMSVISQSR